MTNLNEAEQFETEMTTIWDTDPDNLYDDWHVAYERARHPKWAAVETGRTDDDWAEWEFGDGSRAWILRDGGGVRVDR